MKFMYDNRYRTYGEWPHGTEEVEMSLEELTKLAKQLEEEGLFLVIDSIDPDGTFHLGQYDGNY